MSRTVPLNANADADRAGTAARSAEEAVRGPAAAFDHSAEMREIAAQLARLSDPSAQPSAGGEGPPGSPGRIDALRAAVAAIARRQADLDGAEAARAAGGREQADGASGEAAPVPPPAVARTEQPAPVIAAAAPPAPRRTSPGRSPALWNGVKEASDPRRAGLDLSAEVSQTFARFSKDLREAIDAADARPEVASLGRDLRQIGRAVDGLGAALPVADAIARIGQDTRELRDLLKESTARTVPFEGVERQVASLEARLGRLASVAAPAAPPDFGSTVAEVRALLDGFDPGASLTAIEERIDAMTDRIERGLDARGPSGLIEGLSRRVDEVHASLRAQLAASTVDTGPLETLVRGLTDRIGQAREASADLNSLEAAVRAAAERIDGAAAGLDPRGAQAVEAQFARLGERLDRSEASLKALDGVESTLNELFSQFEVTRQVAIDAAETAARTAARDTLRAALQNPNLAHRSAEMPAAVDQMARSLDDIRALQDTAERRTQSALADIQIAVDRLAQRLSGASGRPPADEARRGRPAAEVEEAVRAPLDPADLLIEPGAGRAVPGPLARPEPRADAGRDPVSSAPAVESDGHASFIAAARRAAQAAQASAATSAAAKASERRQVARPAANRPRPASRFGEDTLGRARAFMAQRRRPILLSIAALVLLVGALEVVKLSADPVEATRVGAVATLAPNRAAAPAAASAAPAPVKAAQPAAAPSPTAAAPLPTFVAGASRAQPPADGIGDGLRNAAASGDAAAQLEVGLRYAEGRGVQRDAKQAIAWFEKAAAQGSAPAQYRLGSMYEKGVGVDRDAALATAWYGKAADAGNIRAMHNLAVMSAEGAGGKPDYAKAAQWFGKASTYGVRDSQFNLAILYARGLGIEQSLPQSYTWFAIAAAEGDEDAGKKRDEVAAKLDAKDLASAKAAADAFRAAVPPAAANDAAPPAGGWGTVAPRAPAAPAKVSQL